jgi:hypothetical protein
MKFSREQPIHHRQDESPIGTPQVCLFIKNNYFVIDYFYHRVMTMMTHKVIRNLIRLHRWY